MTDLVLDGDAHLARELVTVGDGAQEILPEQEDRSGRAGPDNIERLTPLTALLLVASSTAATPTILVSRQLLAAEHLALGDVVRLSADPAARAPREFRIAGVYEPIPDPARLGAPALEARLHLPDLVALTADPADPASAESVLSINIALADGEEAPAFIRDLDARVTLRPAVIGYLTKPFKSATVREMVTKAVGLVNALPPGEPIRGTLEPVSDDDIAGLINLDEDQD